ncbi:MAG: hypothetical protein QHC90_03140 [Shinella sp.]|nr:hypothetical protein [Shinella sp.]
MKSKYVPIDTYARLEREWLDIREPSNQTKDSVSQPASATIARNQA